MSQFHLKNLSPLTDRDAVEGVMPVKMTDMEWKELQDEAYATPRGMLAGLLLGFLAWGLIFAVIWAVLTW